MICRNRVVVGLRLNKITNHSMLRNARRSLVKNVWAVSGMLHNKYLAFAIISCRIERSLRQPFSEYHKLNEALVRIDIMPPRKTYILPSDYDCPVDGPIFLGSILSHPLRPYESLNEAEKIEITLPDRVYCTEKLGWQASDSKTLGLEFGIFTNLLSVLFGLGADLGTGYLKNIQDRFRVGRLVTEWFLPSPSYLDRCLRTAHVWQDIKRRKLPPLYVVTGRKLAYGLVSAEQANTENCSGSAALSFNATTLGFPGDIGPRVSGNRAQQHFTGFQGSSDIVLAYQLRRIYYDKKSGGLASKEHNKHVSLSLPVYEESTISHALGEGDRESDDEQVVDIRVQGPSAEGVGVPQLQSQPVVSGFDEEGVECDIVRC